MTPSPFSDEPDAPHIEGGAGSSRAATDRDVRQSTDSALVPAQQQQNGSKKRRVTTTAFTRRKRAVAACQLCRLRKTKCDAVRPTCGFCRYHQAKCIYDHVDESPSRDEQLQVRTEGSDGSDQATSGLGE